MEITGTPIPEWVLDRRHVAPRSAGKDPEEPALPAQIRMVTGSPSDTLLEVFAVHIHRYAHDNLP